MAEDAPLITIKVSPGFSRLNPFFNSHGNDRTWWERLIPGGKYRGEAGPEGKERNDAVVRG